MLRLHTISLYQFKNYHQRQFSFAGRITGILGRNGVGKTNLLDAIHYLCFTRSYFTRLETLNVEYGCQGFRLLGRFSLGGREEEVVCILRETGKKEFQLNGEPYQRFSQHIGKYPCVMIAPDDIRVITEGSDERRRWMDTLLSQLDPDYLQHLIAYNRILLQRNTLLKRFAETGHRDLSLLEVLDGQLVPPGQALYKRRRDFLAALLPEVAALYRDIAGQPEPVTLQYESDLQSGDFGGLLEASRPRDLISQRTCTGVHRDELVFTLGENTFRQVASQGQRKSLLFALKLAELGQLKREKGFAPILLLDDVFEKLDEQRIASLLQKVVRENDGPVFITDTHELRLRQHLEPLGEPFELIEL